MTDPLLNALCGGLHPAIWQSGPTDWSLSPGRPVCGLLSGSFNPLHEGHRGLLEAAAKRLGGPVAYELSMINADKSPLNAWEIEWRARQFAGEMLVVTRVPTFAEKSRLFPGMTFVVGADTAARILDPRFYDNNPQRLADALEDIAAVGCRFLVAVRRCGPRLLRREDLPIPSAYRDLFLGMPSHEFRMNVSSTELRQQSGLVDRPDSRM